MWVSRLASQAFFAPLMRALSASRLNKFWGMLACHEPEDIHFLDFNAICLYILHNASNVLVPLEISAHLRLADPLFIHCDLDGRPFPDDDFQAVLELLLPARGYGI